MTNTRGKSTVVVPALKKRKGPGATSSSASVEVGLADEVRAFITTASWNRFFNIIEPTYMELTLEFCSTFYLQRVMSSHDEHGTITFRLGGLVRHMNVLEFGAVLGIYTDKFMGADNFLHLYRHIHYSPSCCWTVITASQIPYDASRSKATSLSPVLRYIHALLAHTLTARRESTGVTDRHRKGSICLSPYVTHLARHTGPVLDPYIKDFTDDVPPYHEDPPQPPPLSYRHAPSAASSLGVSSEEFASFLSYMLFSLIEPMYP
ncbi:hypothetical protein GOBAR_AA11250 [Gossypium barbadense]|uniref:Arabidopsis retrotransposon Orf1 C-terminal domain-containing protein n=1 Tax=Gossypium barbadense TaxID=3634 RepID=A0A2P5Y1C7_GOSBA|nr:hypothetical protein GOBAR_AA11250 [Gossypium barbadense]